MKFDSFLENLYFGRLDESVRYDEATDDDPKVKSLLAAFRDACADFPPARLEELGRVPDELIARLKTVGFFGLSIPGEYGGVGLSLHQYLALVKEIVKIDMAVGILALAHLSIGMKAILLFGTEEQKRTYLTKAASGEMIFAYALTEPKIGSDARNVDTLAEPAPDGAHYVLNGVKTFITNANYAGGLTVFAQMDRSKKGTLGAFIVERAWPGVSVGRDMEKMGLKASSTASIRLNDVLVPKENLIGAPGEGFRIAMTVLNYGRLALGAAAAGSLEVSARDMAKRARERVQFERPIVEFELIREKIARAALEHEAVRAITHFTASLLEKDKTAYVLPESSHVKLYGTNAAWESLYEAMQTAGGAGYLAVQPYEKRLRDSRVATIFEGTTEIHSIYPPVSLLRNFSKRLSAASRSPLGRALAVLRLRLAPPRWSARDPDPVVARALRAAGRYALVYRRLFLSAAARHGRRLLEHEFLLRRLTRISVELFILVALAYRIRFLRDKNADSGGARRALRYFLSRARRRVRKNDRLEASPGEKIEHEAVEALLAGGGA